MSMRLNLNLSQFVLLGDRRDMGLCQWRYTEIWRGHFQIQGQTGEDSQGWKWTTTENKEIMIAFL